jgi:hypothetical protein
MIILATFSERSYADWINAKSKRANQNKVTLPGLFSYSLSNRLIKALKRLISSFSYYLINQNTRLVYKSEFVLILTFFYY